MNNGGLGSVWGVGRPRILHVFRLLALRGDLSEYLSEGLRAILTVSGTLNPEP